MAGGRKVSAISNVYTIILALAAGATAATAFFVAYKCLTQYETLFQIAQIGY